MQKRTRSQRYVNALAEMRIEPLEDRKLFSAIPAAVAAGHFAVTEPAARSVQGVQSNNPQAVPLAAPQLPAPVANSPGSSTSPGPVITTLTPTFTWQAISGVTFTGYQINLHNITTNATVSYTTGISVTSYTVPTSAALTAGDSYVWNVRALNGTESGSPSIYLYFQTAPAAALPAPVAVSPGTSASPGPVLTTLTPTFTWQAISGVTFTGYQINLHNVTAGTTVSYTTGASVTSYTVPSNAPLIAGDAYVWNVRALNGTQSGSPSVYLFFQAPPATVALPAPVAVSPGSSTSPGPVLTTLTPTFTWHAISGVTFTGYQINLYNVTANTTVSYTTGTSVTSYTVPTSAPLIAGDAYVWTVRALNGTQSGPPSVYLYFQAPPATQTLPAPVAVSPGSSVSPGPILTTLTPTFTWQAITGVTFTGYQINLHNVTANTTVSYTTGTSVTSYTVPTSAPLIAGDAYVWNVRALNGTQSGPPSVYLYFQAPPATQTLPAPVAVSPGSSVSPGPILTTLTPTFTWQAITGVTFTGYQINLYNVTANTTVSYTTGTSVTSYTVPTSAPLIAGDAYVWNVRALNGTASGPPSVYLYFQAPPAITNTLPAPVAVSPGSSLSPGPVLTTLTPTFTWEAISGVTFTGYQINLYNATTSTTVSYTTGVSVSSFTVPASSPLIAGDDYVWNVRALNGTASGPPSVYLYFQAPPAMTTALPAPVAVSPGTTISPGPVLTTLTPTLTWQAISGVTFTGYQINLFDITTNTSVSYATGAGDTSFTVPASFPLVAGHSYVWNVRGVNGTQSGTPSVYLYFQAPPAVVSTALPAPVSVAPGLSTAPGPVITTLTPTFIWQAISGVSFTGYQINLYNQTTRVSTSYTTGTSVTSFTVPNNAPLAAGDAYVWNVRALNGTQSGPPSVYLYFQTPMPTTLAAPLANSPGSAVSPGPALTTLNPAFSWNAITNVSITAYQIYIHDVTADTTIGYQVDASETSFTPTTPLTPGDSFVWNVRGLNGTESGLPSNYLYFQTPAPVQPVYPVVGNPISTVQPGLVRTNLPASITAGEDLHGQSVVRVTNTTGARFKGAVTTELYASADGAIDSSSILIASMIKTLVIRAGKTVNVVVKIKSLPATLDGTYSVLARTTDSTGAIADSSYGPTVQVAAPFVALSAVVAPLSPSALKSGATVVLSNYGNMPDVTSLHIVYGFSTDSAGQIPAGSVDSSNLRRVTIKAGRSIKLHLHGWLPLTSSLSPGSYFFTVILTDASGRSATAVSMTSVVKT